jgi:hypothetical protein
VEEGNRRESTSGSTHHLLEGFAKHSGQRLPGLDLDVEMVSDDVYRTRAKPWNSLPAEHVSDYSLVPFPSRLHHGSMGTRA